MKRNHTTEQFPKRPYAQVLKMVGLTHAKRIVVDRWLVNIAGAGTSWVWYRGGKDARCRISTVFMPTYEFYMRGLQTLWEMTDIRLGEHSFLSYTSETLMRGTEAANVTLSFLFVANLSL